MKRRGKTLKEMFGEPEFIDESIQMFSVEFTRKFRSGKLYSFREWCGEMKDLFEILD